MFEINSYLKFRANTSDEWATSDTLENYKEYHDFYKSYNLYKPKDFLYKYNDYGFRCDDFSSPTDINIVFLGCSVTCGIGLPIEQVWSHLLLEKIRKKTNKNITFRNLAVGGTGLDIQSTNLYWFNRLNKIDYVFALFPALIRRDYFFKDDKIKTWNASTILDLGSTLFMDEHYRFYQNYRSLAIIESIATDGATTYCTSWDDSSKTDIFNLKEFSSLNYFSHSINSTEYARDGMHPGPTYHRILADLFWNKIEHLF
jgi:hypothetical protein